MQISNTHSTTLKCNTLQHTATPCNTLQCNATHHNTLQFTATQIHCNTLQSQVCHTLIIDAHPTTLQHTTTHCDTLQLQATRTNQQYTSRAQKPDPLLCLSLSLNLSLSLSLFPSLPPSLFLSQVSRANQRCTSETQEARSSLTLRMVTCLVAAGYIFVWRS